MRVTVLFENKPLRGDVTGGPGLSLFIETARRKLLFDTGLDGDVLLRNARTLGVDLAQAELAVLSHGHDDHGNGIAAFCAANSRAPIYLEKDAFGQYFDVTAAGETVYAGLEQRFLRFSDRFIFTQGHTVIDQELQLFSDIRTDDYHIAANDPMTEVREGRVLPDDFRHEQNLLVREGGKTALFTGCAHRGIVNILRRAEELLGRAPDAVFGGFHLYNPMTGALPPENVIRGVAAELEGRKDCRYFTGHCTGEAGYQRLKETLGERCVYLGCGGVFTV